MSEKRFVIDEEGISDNKTDKWYCWKEEVVDLLNELNDETQELKRLIKKMGELGGFNKHLIKTICEDLK